MKHHMVSDKIRVDIITWWGFKMIEVVAALICEYVGSKVEPGESE